MSNPIELIKRVLQYEGGYVKDPDDAGGETYKGISRVFWPKWQGWKMIDSAKQFTGFPGVLKGNGQLDALVFEFYKINFFDKIAGGSINKQKIAGNIFDSAVNVGVIRAVKRAQGIIHLQETGKITPEFSQKLNLLL